MAGGGGSVPPPRPYCRKKSSRIFLAVLRILTAIATAIAALTMYVNEKSAKISDTYNSSTIRFFIYTNASVCVYVLLTLPFAISCTWTNCLVQLLDMLILGIMAAAGAAVTAISYLEKHGGNERARACSQHQSFCYRVAISLLGSYSGLGLLYLICVINFISCSKIAIKTTIIHN